MQISISSTLKHGNYMRSKIQGNLLDRHNESQASSPTLYGITTSVAINLSVTKSILGPLGFPHHLSSLDPNHLHCTQHIVHHPSGAQDSVGRYGGTICSDKAVSEEAVRGKRLMKGKK